MSDQNYNENIGSARANVDANSFFSGNLNELEFRPYANLFYPYIWDNAGSNRIVSLTIDAINLNEDKSILPNEKWVQSDRISDDLIRNGTIWGFVETSNSQKHNQSVSNAFCLNGQKLTFYIAPMGHRAGYIDDQWAYCKTSITVTVLNLMDGTEETLKTFSGFDCASDHVDRYFTWSVPEKDNDAFNDYGLFGLYSIRIQAINTYFKDAERRKKLEISYPNTQSHVMQLLTYSGAKELIEVANGGVNILKESISEDYSLEDIFSNTIFDDLNSNNLNDLTDNQKRAIIADQIAVLFMSQHPVVTADHYPSKIIGYGAEEAIRAESIITKAITYGRKFPAIIDRVNDRLFGMLANYTHYNFKSELSELFDDHSQSSQIVRDPTRSIFINDSGIISSENGVDGVLFNPYVVECVNAEVVSYASNATYRIPLYFNSIEIDNIRVTDEFSGSISDGDNKILISFSVIRGDDIVNRIRYTLWTKNSLNRFVYVDEDGTSRSHLFDMKEYGDIEWEIESLSSESSEQGQEGDTVFARIDLEDQDGKVSSFFVEEFMPNANEAPGVPYISALQRQDGSGMVDIEYDYFGTSEINSGYATLDYSTTGSTWITISSDALRGDVGYGIYPGRRNIVWNPNITFSENVPSNLYVRLNLVDVNAEENAGANQAALTLETAYPEVAIRKISMDERQYEFESSESSVSSSSSSFEYSSSSSNSSSSSIDSSSSSIDSSSSSSSSFEPQMRTVSGSGGNPSFYALNIGTYVQVQNGIYDGEYYYALTIDNETSSYLFFDIASDKWIISFTLGGFDPYYWHSGYDQLGSYVSPLGSLYGTLTVADTI